MAVKLHYQIYGSGSPLIAMHGLFGSGDNLKLLNQLDCELHLLDCRNHGKSPHHQDHLIENLVEDLVVYIRQTSYTKVSLLGHSLGGKVAMAFAIKYPAMVDKLIVVDIAPKNYLPRHQAIFEAFREVEVLKPKSRQEVSAILANHLDDNNIIAFLQKNILRNENHLSWAIGWQNIEKNQQYWIQKPIAENATFFGKTLFIQGMNSDFMESQDHAIIFQHFPNTEITGIANAGHWVHAEQPNFFLQEVRNFLNQ